MQPRPKLQTAIQRENNRRHAPAGLPPGTPLQHTHPATAGVAQEHAMLVRHMGKLQASVSALLADKEAQLQALGGEVLRLRAQLLMARTAVLWGLTPCTARASNPPSAQRATSERRDASDPTDLENLASARQLVCQTGCVGHAHHWLTAEGRCQLSGQTCERQPVEEASN